MPRRVCNADALSCRYHSTERRHVGPSNAVFTMSGWLFLQHFGNGLGQRAVQPRFLVRVLRAFQLTWL